eukprot:scaffold6534_cov132-Isochrysis_galbana.AAC.1
MRGCVCVRAQGDDRWKVTSELATCGTPQGLPNLFYGTSTQSTAPNKARQSHLRIAAQHSRGRTGPQFEDRTYNCGRGNKVDISFSEWKWKHDPLRSPYPYPPQGAITKLRHVIRRSPLGPSGPGRSGDHIRARVLGHRGEPHAQHVPCARRHAARPVQVLEPAREMEQSACARLHHHVALIVQPPKLAARKLRRLGVVIRTTAGLAARSPSGRSRGVRHGAVRVQIEQRREIV